MPFSSLALSFKLAVCLSFFAISIILSLSHTACLALLESFIIIQSYCSFCTEFGVSLGHLLLHLVFSPGDIFLLHFGMHVCFFFPGLPYMDSPLQLH